MGYSFTDLGAEGCRRSLNALLMIVIIISTHLGRDKMNAILQTTFSNAFLEWKLFCFNQNCTETYSQVSNYQYGSVGSDIGLALNRRQAIIWTKGGLVYWCIYASLSLNELIIRQHYSKWLKYFGEAFQHLKCKSHGRSIVYTCRWR